MHTAHKRLSFVSPFSFPFFCALFFFLLLLFLIGFCACFFFLVIVVRFDYLFIFHFFNQYILRFSTFESLCTKKK
ncbi:hypothetical protein STCU_10477 [Strigomonas culicis]|uniref:Uncharacterized protein n=1 Tax=Strigomonas culicis TaxID=28005 RepID=S9THZ7_9TRYP|nr:hypothetical protein STCU_10477 [Strigomonas culicis]|eukprot:EPY17667.1 hypothetical protein STCU_10477 [Strigomonas culicis]